MPELPEVETIARQLASIKGSTILSIGKSKSKLRLNLSQKDVRLLVHQKIITAPQRLGKYIIIALPGGSLIFHLGMTGSISTGAIATETQKHEHVTFILQDANGFKYKLVFRDPRRFGGVSFIQGPSASELQKKLNIGIDPIRELDENTLKELAAKSSIAIKPFLMQNGLITGIGNIYASEICFEAALNPERPANSLTTNEIQTLHFKILHILHRAIKLGGSSIRDYVQADGSQGSVQDTHAVYGKQAKTCPRCGMGLLKYTQKQRSTFCCPNCQN